MANKSFQKQKRLNPAATQLNIERRIKQAMTEARASGIEYGTVVHHLLSILVLGDKCGFNDEMMEKYLKGMESYADCIAKEYMTIPGLIIALKEDYGVVIDEDKLIKWYPQIEGYLKPDHE